MAILQGHTGLLEALRGEMTPKFLATRDAAGVPNVVPVVSILPAEDQPDTLFFGNFLLRKSIGNLQQDTRVGILVITPELNGWILRGDFVEFQRTGPYVERQMNSSLLRYNAYTGIRSAGVIRVQSVEATFAISRLQVLEDHLLARLSTLHRSPETRGGVDMPLPVRREFGRMVAVKVMAWIGENGYPGVVPALSLQPADARTLLCWQRNKDFRPKLGQQMAGSILTFEAISYQVKGYCTQAGRSCRLDVQEVYAGGPPLPGGRIA